MCFLPGISFIGLVGLTLNILLSLVTLTHAAPLILFEDSNFKGMRAEYLLGVPGTCVNLRGKLNDLFISVKIEDHDSCFLLCEHEYCRGRCVQVTGSVTNLNAFNFNGMASSIRRCSTSTSTTTTATPESTEYDPKILLKTSKSQAQLLSAKSSTPPTPHLNRVRGRARGLIHEPWVRRSVGNNRHSASNSVAVNNNLRINEQESQPFNNITVSSTSRPTTKRSRTSLASAAPAVQ